MREAPDIARGRLAVLAVFDLLDRRSTIDPASREGHTAVAVSGKVELKDVFFRFPTRPDVQVLDGLTVKAEPGQTVALVGQSGCGKSTVIGMLQRMHDAHKGLVTIEDVSVPSWNVTNLRNHLSLVSQEPTLFNLSIADNIAYGARGGVASMDEVVAAARLANIHNFVLSLPEGYNTVVGSQGGQLSGGQRQRVAIARALIGNPKILLLDEATSALDSDSETLVQEALERAAKGRTTIVIAHRLSTIRGADHIYVLDAGSVVEAGSFEDLVRQGGEFARLVAAQNLGVDHA
ncbi:GTPase-activating protein [Cladochytrium tenue]|nr:GTPase-activating protein [Cladochytrium tenue]